jgi:hypothetical protein
LSHLFGGSTPLPTPPAVTPPPPMPDPFGPASQEAARQAAAKAAVGGRSSTVLTTAANRGRATFAGGAGSGTAYSSSTLGGGK